MSSIYDPIIVVLAAGEAQKIPRAFRDFAIQSATIPDQIAVSFDNAKNFAHLPAGVSFAGLNQPYVWVKNTDAVLPNTITVVASTVGMIDNRTIVAGGVQATTVIDGGDVAQGSRGDAAAALVPVASTVVALLKRLILDDAASATSYAVSPGAAVIEAVVSAVPARLHTLCLDNQSGAAVWLRLYNQVALPGVGDTPFASLMVANGATLALPFPRRCAAGIGVRVTGAAPDNDATVIAAGVHLSISYGV